MKRLIATAIIFAFAAIAHAKDCKTTSDCIMWFDDERALVVVRTYKFNEQQAKSMIKSDILDGSAVAIKKDTILDEVSPVPHTPFVLVELNGSLLVTIKDAVECK